MEVLKKVLNIIIDIFIILVVLVSATVAVLSLSSQRTGVASIFGYVPFSVQTESMSPVLEAGDLIVSKRLDTMGADSHYEFKVGDIVTFWTTIEDDNGEKTAVLNTHRIIELLPDAKGENTAFITKGDNNLVKDKKLVTKDSIVSIWSSGDEQGIKVSNLGSVLTFLRKPAGFFTCVVLPMAVFFIYELVRFITNLIAYNKSKSREAALEAAKEIMGNDGSSDSSGLSEEQKAQAILEYIEKQKQDKVENSEDSAVTEEE